ncbi:MAG: sigma-70, region 4 family protein, partial [Verrucomicrobiaceae bacterium]|nr:sigma-70, region 4 family protein [Verrucomicrobiaceae bacterium]
MNDAIFRSTGQALHVSFLIMSVEARQKNALRMALIQIIEAVEHLTTKQESWLKQLRGDASGTVNFGGLDAYEVRAQCAMVTTAVRDHLPGPERDVVWARYGFQKEKG